MNYTDIINEITIEKDNIDNNILLLSEVLSPDSKVLLFLDDEDKQLLMIENTIMASFSNVMEARIREYNAKSTT